MGDRRALVEASRDGPPLDFAARLKFCVVVAGLRRRRLWFTMTRQ
jgi:hypothetical protein